MLDEAAVSPFPLVRMRRAVRLPIRNGIGAAAEFDDPEWPRYVRITDISGPRSLRNDTFASLPPQLAKEAPLEKGDVLISAVGATFGKSYFRQAGHDRMCYAGYLVRVACDHSLVPDYVAYWTESLHYWNQVRAGVIKATIENFSAARVKDLLLPRPVQSQQKAIVEFLDRETVKADALIAKYERLIELLEEKRVALITRAVTKGLDPNVPMKDSGIVGVGHIPKHWGTPKVWMLFAIGRGRVISQEDILDNPGGYPVYSSQTENDGEMGRIGTYDFDGDYLTWTTDGAKAGTIFERHGKFNCTNVCGTLNARRDVELTYFRYAIGLAATFFVRLDINPKLMNDVMAKVVVPLPPIEEQISIVRYLRPQLAHIQHLKSRINQVIDLVKERRSALITAAVTGQIDVATYGAKESA